MNSNSPVFQPYTLANGVTLKNRIVMAPMTTWSGDKESKNSESELAYYRARAKGVGMVITGTTYAVPNGKGFPGQFSAENDKFVPSLSKLAKTIQSEGAKAILQIFHAGRLAHAELVPDEDVVAPSAVRAKRIDGEAMLPRPLTGKEVQSVIDSFAAATARAIDAGFDGVEIHGANGFLIQQFFSPHANRRSDQWGGDVAGRAKFPLAVADAVLKVAREKAPKTFVVGYRFSPEETGEVGISLTDTLYLLDQLREKPLTYLHVSLKQFDLTPARDTSDKRVIGITIKERLDGKVPFIGVGGIKTRDDLFAAQAIGYDLIAVGSALVADPDWAQKIENGEPVISKVTKEHIGKYAVPNVMFEMMSVYFPNIVEAVEEE